MSFTRNLGTLERGYAKTDYLNIVGNFQTAARMHSRSLQHFIYYA